MPLLQRILAFCREKGISERQFGVRVHNHQIVRELRKGRELGPAVRERIELELKYGE